MRGRWIETGATALIALTATAGCGDSEPATSTTSTISTQQTTRAEPEDPGPGKRPVGDGEGIELEPVGEFDQPVYVTQARADDALYVVERCGTVVRVPESGEPADFLDLSGQVGCESSEQGLLSIAFAPDASRTGRFYVYFTDREGTARVVEYERAADDETAADPGSARELLAIEDFASNHNGGQLQFDADGLLYIGTGDGGGAGDPERTAQDLTSLLGKILRIDPLPRGGEPYAIPAANPHAGDGDARPEVLAHGLRNPWRFTFDRETGDLWIGDVGQDELEEIDSVARGELGSPLDFGWSAFEGTQPFNPDQEAGDAVAPTLEYGRDGGECSVTGGYVVRDRDLESLYGRYLYGDYCTGELRSFVADAGGPAEDDKPVGADVAALSSFGEDSAGGVYAVSLEGQVYRLTEPAR